MANLWISQSAREVKAVNLISIEKKTPRIIFEKWIPDNTIPNRNLQSLRYYSISWMPEHAITITRTDISAEVDGDPLVINIKEIFLRDPVTQGEYDYVLSQELLGEITEMVWIEMVLCRQNGKVVPCSPVSAVLAKWQIKGEPHLRSLYSVLLAFMSAAEEVTA
jgi:hypothetical protein